jgi:hypothetical protein
MRWRFTEFGLSPEEAAARERTLNALDSWWLEFARKQADIVALFSRKQEWDLGAWMREALGAIDEKLMWEFGPGLTKAHRLVITPEVERHLRPLVAEILRRAPSLPDWEFYAYRLPESWDMTMQTVEARTGGNVSTGWFTAACGVGNSVDLSFGGSSPIVAVDWAPDDRGRGSDRSLATRAAGWTCDFVFWGRDAAELAQQCRAGQLDEKHFGWLDLPVEEAARLGDTVEKKKASTGLKAATDFRPHSHHYAIMREVRSSETESGVIDLAGARLCSFMTSWGDGIFEIYRDFNAAGHLVRIRIEMGTPDRVELLREVWRR